VPYFDHACPKLVPVTRFSTPTATVGEIRADRPGDEVELNVGLTKAEIYVINIAGRPVQVGSHAHLADVNPDLLFFKDKATAEQVTRLMQIDPRDVGPIKELAEVPERGAAHWGFRWNIASGASLRFEPMCAPDGPFSIVAIGGDRVVPGIRLDKDPADRQLGP